MDEALKRIKGDKRQKAEDERQKIKIKNSGSDFISDIDGTAGVMIFKANNVRDWEVAVDRA